MWALSAFRQRFLGQPRFNAQSYFTVPLFDLGEISPQFTGILAPEPERGTEKIGITEQFLEDAATYHERYAHTDHFMRLFKNGLQVAGIKPQPKLRILDIGAGSGANSVVPCAQLFPKSEIIATDLSPQLLVMLRGYLQTADLPVKVACVCTDAMNDFIQPGRFDLVIGAAILHHLMDPSKAVMSASRALRPGGIAIFMEPYEAGHLALAAAFLQILSRRDQIGELAPAPEKVLLDMIKDWMARVGHDKSAPHFPYMDDKWLFTRPYMHEIARAAGFKDVIFVSTASTDRQFRAQTETLLRLHSGLAPSALPDWAWSIINALDETFSDEPKDEMLMEAVTVFRR